MSTMYVSILSAVLGGGLAGGLVLMANRTPNVEAARTSVQAVDRSEPQPVVVVPEVAIPGYQGLLYDREGRVVAVAVEKKEAVAPKSVSASPSRVTSAPSRVVSAPVRKSRSTGKSVAIVAGSAGTGAAIGGIAAGGKGAAIGAISGGAAGLIYDRTTKDKK